MLEWGGKPEVRLGTISKYLGGVVGALRASWAFLACLACLRSCLAAFLLRLGPVGMTMVAGSIGEDMAEALRLRDSVDGDDSCWYRSL